MKKTPIPRPPLDLTKEENSTYRAIARHLADNKALDKIDAWTIAQAARCFGRICTLENELKGLSDIVQIFESGASNVTGAFTALNTERKQWNGYVKMFGLSIEAREKLLAFKADANNEPGVMSKLRDIREKSRKAV